MADPERDNAAVFGQCKLVRAILAGDPGAVHARDQFGFTVLHGVAGEDHPEMIGLLAAAGADESAADSRSQPSELNFRLRAQRSKRAEPTPHLIATPIAFPISIA